MDKETEEFAAKVLLCIQQAKRGEFARVHAPGDTRPQRRMRRQPCLKAAPDGCAANL